MVYWTKANDPAARAIGLEVRVALGCELLEGGVKWVHLFQQVLENYAARSEYQDDYD